LKTSLTNTVRVVTGSLANITDKRAGIGSADWSATQLGFCEPSGRGPASDVIVTSGEPASIPGPGPGEADSGLSLAQPDRANAAKRAIRRKRKGTSFTVVRLSRRWFTRRNKVMNFARVPIAPVFENQTLIPEIGGSPSCVWNGCSSRLP
jgi:hypothetical protein